MRKMEGFDCKNTGRYGNNNDIEFYHGEYFNGRVAIRAQDVKTGEQDFTATINLPDLECPPGETWIKDYSENEGVKSVLQNVGMIEPIPTAKHELDHGIAVHRWKFTRKALKTLSIKEG